MAVDSRILDANWSVANWNWSVLGYQKADLQVSSKSYNIWAAGQEYLIFYLFGPRTISVMDY